MKNDLKSKLEKLENKYLIDVLANYKKYNYPAEAKKIALDLLKQRKVPKNEYENLASRINSEKKLKESKKDKLKEYYNKFKRNSIICLIFFAVSILIFILINFILDNNIRIILLILRLILVISYFIFYIKSFLNYYSFNKEYYPDYSKTASNFLFFMIGIPLFFIFIIYYLSDMKKRL